MAARLGRTALIRTLSHRGAQVVLTPAASGYEFPEVVLGPGDDFAILGTVATVLRPFHDQAVANEATTDGNGAAEWVSVAEAAPPVS